MGERNHWQLLTVGDLCVTTTSGGTPSRKRPEYFVHNGIPWLKTQELSDCVLYDASEHISEVAVTESSAKLLPVGTVLVAMYGATAGQLGLLGKPMTCNQACCALIVDETKADPRFLYYALLNDRLGLRSLANGAAQQNLNVGIISRFPILAPPLSEQRAIAEVLGALDDKIEANRRVVATVDALARAEVEAAQATADRLLPLGSLLKRVNDIARPSELAPATVYIGLEHMSRGSLFLTEWGVAEGLASAKARFQPGDILFGKLRPYFKKVAIAPTAGVCSTDVLVLRPTHWVQGSLGLVACASDGAINYASSGSHGTRMPRVSWEYLSTWQVLVPGAGAMQALEQRVGPMIQHAVHLIHESALIAQLRDTLLPKLLSGELRVRDARHCSKGGGAALT